MEAIQEREIQAMNHGSSTLSVSAPSENRSTNSRRLVSKFQKIPFRIKRTIRQICDGTYVWESKAKRGVSWLEPGRRSLLENLNGTSSVKECQLLAWLASVAPAGGVVVEIGAFHGRSTAWLCEGAIQQQPRLSVYSIDPHEGNTWEPFQNTVAAMDLESRGLKVIRSRSQAAGQDWKLPISMIWIDGCHKYKEVCEDITLFVPHIVPGGWIVFDDAAGGKFPGCEKAIADCMPAFTNIVHRVTLRHLQLFQVMIPAPK